MVDDTGYSDIGCFGGQVKTPNLARKLRAEADELADRWQDRDEASPAIHAEEIPDLTNGGVPMRDRTS